MEELINKCQSKINKMIKKSNATYESVVIPLVTEILASLSNTHINNWYIKNHIDAPIDIYAEALALFIMYNSRLEIPIDLIALIIVAHPYLLSIIQERHNKQSWKEYKNKLLPILQTHYSSVHSAKIIISSLLSNEEIENESSLNLIHCLAGFNFTIENTTKTINELMPEIQKFTTPKSIIISLNIGYNIKNTNSVICYKNIPKLKNKLLSYDKLGLFEMFSMEGIKQEITEPFELFDINFKPLSTIPDSFDKALVLINYNNTNNYLNNYYTIAMYDKFVTLLPSQARDFMQYKLIYSIDRKLIAYYLKQSFYASIYFNDLKVNDLKKTYTKLMNIVSNNYRVTEPLTNFIEKLVEDVKTQRIINKCELPYFKIYLLNLKSIELSPIAVINYVLSYIYPDLLTSSLEL